MKILMLSFLLSITITAYSQEKTNFIEVRLHSGYTIYGTTSFKLLREGFIYRTIPHDSTQEEVKFIPSKNLNTEKIFQIQKYIYDENLFNIDRLFIPEDWSTTARPIVIEFIILGTNHYNVLDYYYCDERMDKLIEMINELVPEIDRYKFRMNQRCP